MRSQIRHAFPNAGSLCRRRPLALVAVSGKQASLGTVHCAPAQDPVFLVVTRAGAATAAYIRSRSIICGAPQPELSGSRLSLPTRPVPTSVSGDGAARAAATALPLAVEKPFVLPASGNRHALCFILRRQERQALQCVTCPQRGVFALWTRLHAAATGLLWHCSRHRAGQWLQALGVASVSPGGPPSRSLPHLWPGRIGRGASGDSCGSSLGALPSRSLNPKPSPAGPSHRAVLDGAMPHRRGPFEGQRAAHRGRRRLRL